MSDHFENKILGKREVHCSRYIASWNNAKHGQIFGDRFRQWLMAEEGLSEDESWYVLNMANCGKLELEYSCRKYIEMEKKDEEFIEKYGIDAYMDSLELR